MNATTMPIMIKAIVEARNGNLIIRDILRQPGLDNAYDVRCMDFYK